MSQITGIPTIFMRKQAKEYGTCKAAEGPPVAGLRVVLVEDVVTTGGALRDACPMLRGEGAIVDTAVCAIDRQQGGEARLREASLGLRPALTRDLLEASVRA
jgi:orotate phosphoribosyltransferase